MAEDLEGALAGGGDMGALMRSMDWSKTGLGPVSSWPRSLLTSVGICLNSRYPMFIWWGPGLCTLYNDAYRDIISAKHPRALGAPAREVWPEIWDVISPMIEEVRTRGTATWSDDLCLALRRKGFVEECYFTFSYGPIRDEAGGIGGIFSVVSESTRKVLGERRLKALRDLAARGQGARDAGAACRSIADTLASNAADLPFALVYLLDAGAREVRLEGAAGLPPGAPASPSAAALNDPAGPWPLGEALLSGAPVRVRDLGGLGDLPGGAWPEPAREAVVLPIASSSRQDKVAGFLVAGLSPRLAYDEEYQGFLGLVAGQAASIIESASAYAEERRRADALAELDRAKTAFFSNISHEFRTPLTLMLGPAEDLLSEGGGLTEGARDKVSILHRNSVRLLKLVNNLLDFSRLEAGRAQASFAPVNLAALTSDLAGGFRSAVEKAGLALAVDCPPLPEPVYVDKDMWEKVVLNLLSNAFKFTLQGRIEVALRAADGRADLTVRDTGAGIPAAEMPNLFKRFHRVRGAQARTCEGSGIGLALVQELVRLHGGTVRAESREGAGTAFTVSLPFGRAHLPAGHVGPAQAGAASGAHAYVLEALRWHAAPSPAGEPALVTPTLPSPAASPARRPRVLVVDDNADMGDYLRRILEPRYRVEVRHDGAAALETALASPPDLVLSDVMMPGLDGFGLLSRLKADARTAEVPVILLSARAGEEATVEGIEAGADDYLVKPFSGRELLARVAARLEIARARRQAELHRFRLHSLFAEAPALVCIFRGPEHAVEFANPPYARLLGNRNLHGRTVRELFPGIEKQAILGVLDGVYRTGESFHGREFTVTLDFGSGAPEEKSFDFVYQALRDADGAVEGVALFGFEVTDQVAARRKAEAVAADLKDRNRSLEAAEKEIHKFMTLVEQSSDLVTILDAEGGISFVNAKGRKVMDARGLDRSRRGVLFDLFFPEDHASVRAVLKAAWDKGAWEGEFRHKDAREGRSLPIWWNVFALRDHGTGRPFALASVSRDLTQLKETEEHLRQTQKMEAVGKLAGGIAHDFNNLLTAINGYADLAVLVGGDGPAAEYLREIRKSGERAATLTQQLLAYSRKQVLAPKVISLNSIVGDMERMIQRLIGEDIEMSVGLDPRLGLVKVDPGQMGQILLNLVFNARDAMPHGGRLIIATSNAELDASHVPTHFEAAPGPYVMLEVRDTGTGMSEDVKAQIFEPFFTTKEVGKGTGLGLSSVYGIVRQSGGSISVHSRPGGGSSFRVHLPRVMEPFDQASDSPAPASMGLARGQGRILLAEDEEPVRNFVRITLEMHGYEVIVARDGQEALEMGRAFPKRIDLLLTDVIMPQVGGSKLAALLRPLHPETKVLYMSGYTNRALSLEDQADTRTEFLQKPFQPGQLIQRIQDMLKERRETPSKVAAPG